MPTQNETVDRSVASPDPITADQVDFLGSFDANAAPESSQRLPRRARFTSL
jgi:hypothetical protein